MITRKLVFDGKNIKLLIDEDLNLLKMGEIGKLLHKGETCWLPGGAFCPNSVPQ